MCQLFGQPCTILQQVRKDFPRGWTNLLWARLRVKVCCDESIVLLDLLKWVDAQVLWKPTQSCMIAPALGLHTHILAKKDLKSQLIFVADVNVIVWRLYKFAVLSPQISQQIVSILPGQFFISNCFSLQRYQIQLSSTLRSLQAGVSEHHDLRAKSSKSVTSVHALPASRLCHLVGTTSPKKTFTWTLDTGPALFHDNTQLLTRASIQGSVHVHVTVCVTKKQWPSKEFAGCNRIHVFSHVHLDFHVSLHGYDQWKCPARNTIMYDFLSQLAHNKCIKSKQVIFLYFLTLLLKELW